VNFLLQGNRNFISVFGFCFDTFTFNNLYFALKLTIKDEAVTTQTLYFAWLIPLSATEHATQTVYSSLILTHYCQIFILILSSHFAWLIPLSATEHATQTVYSSLILTHYCQIFILILSSHQHPPSRNFKSTFPNTVALRRVNQTCELHLSNDCK